MNDYLLDTNVVSQVLKNNVDLITFVQSLNIALETTVYIESLQGQKSNDEKRKVKKFIDNFSLLHFTPSVSRRAIELIDRYSNTNGLLLADAQIAAACLEYDLTLVTYNGKDFQFIANLNLLTPPFAQI